MLGGRAGLWGSGTQSALLPTTAPAPLDPSLGRGSVSPPPIFFNSTQLLPASLAAYRRGEGGRGHKKACRTVRGALGNATINGYKGRMVVCFVPPPKKRKILPPHHTLVCAVCLLPPQAYRCK